jgi:glycosyltransferase involved in cell wall biosynthesis
MTNFRISVVHPTGNPNAYNVAIALGEAGLLHEVITTIGYNSKASISHYLNRIPEGIRNRIVRRLKHRSWTVPETVAVKLHPWQEIIRLTLTRTHFNRTLGFSAMGPFNWVSTSLDRHVAQYHLQGLSAIYGYEDVAAETFQEAKQQGILCLYDLPIAFYQTSYNIHLEEAQRFPNLAPALQAAREPSFKIERKHREVQLADLIFVPSSFVRNSLLDAGINSNKIYLLPFGAPIDYFFPQPKTDNCFRALFVGRVGPRKGVHYLLKAWQELQLPEAELVLVGVNEFPEQFFAAYQDMCRYVPFISHASLNHYYSSASVFVFPSLVEGLALVQLEAMACGIPIITTPNSGGTDILADGVEGFIIPIRDVEALKEKLEWCYRHPQELAEMGRAARRKAEQLTWDLYRKKLVDRVWEVLKN